HRHGTGVPGGRRPPPPPRIGDPARPGPREGRPLRPRPSLQPGPATDGRSQLRRHHPAQRGHLPARPGAHPAPQPRRAQGQPPGLSLLTFNIGNPSADRAERQLAWLASRDEHVLVLTETKASAGCKLLADAFASAGYAVCFPEPAPGEYGTMIVAKVAALPDS